MFDHAWVCGLGGAQEYAIALGQCGTSTHGLTMLKSSFTPTRGLRIGCALERFRESWSGTPR
ncbi:MAG: hypothetical protein KJ749_03320 [Planctomycetes bacterium]|nr:hypothetical protein [Planctomycetota bacterium]